MNSPRQDGLDLEGSKPGGSKTADLTEQILDVLFIEASALSARLCVVDAQLQCVRSNSNFAAISNLPLEEHPGLPLSAVLPHLFSTLQPLCQQVLATQAAVVNIKIENWQSSSSQPVSWAVSCFPISLAPDQPLWVGLVLADTPLHPSTAEPAPLSSPLPLPPGSNPQFAPDTGSVETLQRQFEQERLINKVAMQILQSNHLQDIFNMAVEEVRQFLQADRVVISRRQAGREYYFVAESVQGYASCLGSTFKETYSEAFSNDRWIETRGWSIDAPGLEQLDEQPNEHLLDDQTPAEHLPTEPLNNTLLGLSSPLAIAQFSTLQIKSRLAMPILLGEQIWGIVAAHQCSETRYWQPVEVELLEKLATQLAIGIQQAELHQRIQRLNDQLENEVQARTAELQVAFEFEATLKRITDRVRDSLDEDLILQAAVRELVLVLKISGCNASLYDLDQGTSTTCYEYTTSLSPYQGRVSKFSSVPEIYNQLLRGQYFQFCSLVPNPERGLVSALACPILDDQGVIGDLWLIHHKYYAFNEQDIRLVQQVANQCAIAIRQARLYEESQTQVKELERLNQLKDDFLSTVSHELRTPLSNIKMAIHMLRTAPDPDKRERYMTILEAECSRETELINDLLDLQKLENDSYRVNLEPIDLKDWLPQAIAPFVSRANNRQQVLGIHLPDNLPLLLSDRKSLERILAELLNNACKYTPPQGSINLEVVHLPNHEATLSIPITTFRVSNQATVPPEELPRMFEKFYRIPRSDPWQQGGTGLGLALVQKLVETLQGNITASSLNGWTTLRVDLPMPIHSAEAD